MLELSYSNMEIFLLYKIKILTKINIRLKISGNNENFKPNCKGFS